jgi:hypothetical protein
MQPALHWYGAWHAPPIGMVSTHVPHATIRVEPSCVKSSDGPSESVCSAAVQYPLAHWSAVPHAAPAPSVPAGVVHAPAAREAHVGAAARTALAHDSAAESAAGATPAAPRRDSQKAT